MDFLKERAKCFLASEDGPTVTEYAVMLALIIVVCIAAIFGIGTKVESMFSSMADGLPEGTAGGG